jgi:hypothetical protein
MFYTLASRFLITKITSPRDYLYIFLAGSVGYVALHWYLHMDKRNGFTEKIREYLYYTMVIDIITAYTLMTMYPLKSDKKINNEENNQNNAEQQYTPDQRKALMQRMQEARRLQQMRHKELIDPPPNHGLPKQNSKAVKNNESDKSKTQCKDENGEAKRSIFTKSDESRESVPSDDSESNGEPEQPKDILVKGKKKEETEDGDVDDTEIPIFESKKKK